jgi:hypothetical protein
MDLKTKFYDVSPPGGKIEPWQRNLVVFYAVRAFWNDEKDSNNIAMKICLKIDNIYNIK